MSSLFADPAFHAQRNLKALGYEVKRAQVFEIFAGLFGYHHHRDMQLDLADIEYAIRNSAPYVVLQPPMGYSRLREILPRLDEDQLHVALMVICNELTKALPTTVHLGDDAFIDYFGKHELSAWHLDSNSESVMAAQMKVATYCDHFRVDGFEIDPLIEERGDVWSGSIYGELCRSLPSGAPALTEDQITTSSYVAFEKLGRVLLAPDPVIRTGATAFTPHPSMGGVRL
nr:hypothetical protein [uncultured Roseateles sp.]